MKPDQSAAQSCRCQPFFGRGLTKVILAAAVVLVSGLAAAQAQSTILWSSSGGSAWLTNTNWTGNVVPGINDIAEFGTNPNGGGQSNGVGVNFGNPVNNGTFTGAAGTLGDQAVGAIVVLSSRNDTLFIGNTKNSPSGYMTLNGATVNSQANTILSNASAQTLTIQNNVQGSSGSTFGLALGGTSSFVQTAAGSAIVITSTIDQVNSGSAITLLGGGNSTTNGGTLELSGANSFTGGITVGNAAGTNAGTVQIDTTSSLPTTGSITVNSNSQLLLYNTNSTTLTGTYGGTGQTLTLNGVGTASNSGALRVDGSGTINATWQGTVTLGSDSIISVTTGNTLALTGDITDNGHLLQKQGSGSLTISGTANNMSGATQIGNGSLIVSSGSQLGTGSLTLAQTSTNATTLTLNNTTQSVGSLSSTWTATTGTIGQRINLNGTALTVNQTVDGTFGTGAVSTLTSTIAGTGSLIKTGAATLTLSSANTYSGTTTVSGGTLQVAGSLANTSGVTVNSGGTLLLTGAGGTNAKLNSAATVILNGGTLSTGGLTGSLNQTVGALTLSASSVIDFGTLGTTTQLNFANSSGITWAGTLSIYDWNPSEDSLFFGNSAGGLTSTQLSDISFYGGSGTDFLGDASISSSGELEPIPEPSAVAFGAGLLGLIIWRERKRFSFGPRFPF